MSFTPWDWVWVWARESVGRGPPQNSEDTPARRKLSCVCWRYQWTRGGRPRRTTMPRQCWRPKAENRRRRRSGSADLPVGSARTFLETQTLGSWSDTCLVAGRARGARPWPVRWQEKRQHMLRLPRYSFGERLRATDIASMVSAGAVFWFKLAPCACSRWSAPES